MEGRLAGTTSQGQGGPVSNEEVTVQASSPDVVKCYSKDVPFLVWQLFAGNADIVL